LPGVLRVAGRSEVGLLLVGHKCLSFEKARLGRRAQRDSRFV